MLYFFQVSGTFHMSNLPGQKFSTINAAAFRVSLIYAVFSILWILFSDQLLLLLVTDLEIMTKIQILKGWIFVLVTSLIIYFLLLREVTRVIRIQHALGRKEQDYQEVFNATNEGIIIHDAKTGDIVDVNVPFLKMFNFRPQQIPGMTVQDLSQGMPPFNQQEAEKRIQLAITEGPQMFEWHCRRADGELFWAEVTLKMAKVGGVDRVISVLRNVDDRKRMEEQGAEYEKRFQQAQKMEAIGTLAGGVAHDFNNILSAVLGYAELARDEIPADSRAARHLQEVTRAGNRAKELVKQILTFSRNNQPQQKPVLMQVMVKEAVKLLRASIPTTIKIELNIDGTCGAVLADPTQLHQIVMNLCTNAYHAMREGGGVLTLGLLNVTLKDSIAVAVGANLPAGEYILFTVADTGTGIEGDISKKIFEPYFTTKSKGEGSGMGLSVVHGIVTHLGGGITVNSNPGKGTTFEVYIPVNSQTVASVVEKTNLPVGGRTGMILFVDDEEVLANLGKSILERCGYTVTVETDSRKALELFQCESDKYDLILTDMNMPQMDGLALIRECRKIRPEVPVILYTGYSERVDRDQALARGVDEFLQKPMQRQELIESIERVLSRRKSRQ
jgi:PAS domain S-box-containing protein